MKEYTVPLLLRCYSSELTCGQSSSGETRIRILCWVGPPVGLKPKGSRAFFVAMAEMIFVRPESLNLKFLNLTF